jgi:hypothetical protein
MAANRAYDADVPRLVQALGQRATEVNLNLVWDYPVFWSKYKVLRDLVQNFYDAVGPAAWNRRFHVRIEGDSLHLRADETGFSYEWLLHIGASTKRARPSEFAGHFGEGFKIAALCAARDFHWTIELASRGWGLRVGHGDAQIEGNSIRTLAYRVWDGLPERSYTELCLWPFEASDGDVLQAALVSFFYGENPLFGEKLWADATAAVYLRNEVSRPPDVPKTYEHEGPGIVFVGRQALGSVRYPVVLALHEFHQIDRERNALYGSQVVDVWRSVASRMDADAAIALLALLRREWYARPRKKYDFACYRGVVSVLVERISRDPSVAARFRKEHPHLLVAGRVRAGDIAARNRRTQALAWLHSLRVRHRLVQEGFLRLGYSTIEAACEADDGFTVVREPTDAERIAVELLREVTTRCFAALFDVEDLPPTRILRDGAGVWMGMAVCVPVRSKGRGSRRFDLPYVALKRYLLAPGCGSQALSTYLHELGHMYGPDASARFSHLLTDIARETIRHAGEMKRFLEQWDVICTALPEREGERTSSRGREPSPDAGRGQDVEKRP